LQPLSRKTLVSSVIQEDLALNDESEAMLFDPELLEDSSCAAQSTSNNFPRRPLPEDFLFEENLLVGRGSVKYPESSGL
jgi:hypothetical protein